MSADHYFERGVSSSKQDVRHATQSLDKGLFPRAFCKVLPDDFTYNRDFAVIMHSDTAGTKTVLAYLHWKETGDLSVWKGIMQDALVMNLDDMACAGMIDNFICTSIIARNRFNIPGEVLSALIEGAQEFIQELDRMGVRVNWGGGETADVSDTTRTLDVGFSVVGMIRRSDVLSVQIQPGQVIVGFASDGQTKYEPAPNSGIGCNGLTSARHDLLSKFYKEQYPESFDPNIPDHLCYNGHYRLTDKPLPDVDQSIGQLILSPTRTYLPLLKIILKSYRARIQGVIHCTGGGQTKCLHFADNVHIIKDHLFTPPPIFGLIQHSAQTTWHEMYRTFNMGHRLEVYTNADTARSLIDLAADFNLRAQVIGKVVASKTKKLTIVGPEGEMVYE
jgi:phosphoribosylformylglycinamidine cyclo-ligase